MRPVLALAAALGAALLASGRGVTPGEAQGPATSPFQGERKFHPDSMPWAAGERLEYGIKFSLFNVGQGSLEVLGLDTVRGTQVWNVRFAIQGGALGWDLVDTMQSWFGANDFVTRRFVHNSDEDGRLRQRTFEMFPQRGIYVRNATDTQATVVSPLDDASFFFYARTLPLEMGQTYSIARYFVRDRNPVIIRVLRRQTISVPAGRFRCLVIQPIFKSRGLFGQGGQAYIWLSDDSARIPVRIRGSLPIGTLEMSLRARR